MISIKLSENGGAAPEAVPYMPPGVQEICATVNGKAGRRRVRVDEAACGRLQADLERMLAAAERGERARPMLMFDHRAGAAAARPLGFEWDPVRGVLLRVEWTAAGRAAVEGGNYAYVSPAFALRRGSEEILGLSGGVEVGSLVNDPAFERNECIAAGRVPDGCCGEDAEVLEGARWGDELVCVCAALGLDVAAGRGDVLLAVVELVQGCARAQERLVRAQEEVLAARGAVADVFMEVLEELGFLDADALLAARAAYMANPDAAAVALLGDADFVAAAQRKDRLRHADGRLCRAKVRGCPLEESARTGKTTREIIKDLPPVEIDYTEERRTGAQWAEDAREYFLEHFAGKQMAIGKTGYRLHIPDSKNKAKQATTGVNTQKRTEAFKNLQNVIDNAVHLKSEDAKNKPDQSKKKQALLARTATFETFGYPATINGERNLIWFNAITKKHGDRDVLFYEFGCTPLEND